MYVLPRTARVAVSLSLSLALTPLLAACNPADIVSGAVQQAVKDQTGVDINVNANGGSVSLPSDFPKDVPVVSGSIMTSASVGTGASKVWTIAVKVNNSQTAYNDAKSKLQAAGFTIDADIASGDEFTLTASKGDLSVLLGTGQSGSDKILTYTVGSSK